MLTECKCGNPVEAKLDVDTNKVICQNCKKEITHISDFMKASMKQNGDIIRHETQQIPEGGIKVECNTCHKPLIALLNKKDDEVYCPHCSNVVNINPFTKALLRENGQYIGSANGEDKFVGSNPQKTKPGQVVQIDENGVVRVVEADAEDDNVSPFEKLQAFQKAKAEQEALDAAQVQLKNKVIAAQAKKAIEEAKQKETAEFSRMASIGNEEKTEIAVTTVGNVERPATIDELVAAKNKLLEEIAALEAQKAAIPVKKASKAKKTK